MQNARYFKEKIANGKACIGSEITFTDPTITEALSDILDYVWLDMEHGPLSIEDVQLHCMAVKGSDCTALVRVPINEYNVINKAFDVGADGVIVPMVKTVEDVEYAIKASKFPPEGIRGYGPRRQYRYGALGGAEFCKKANAETLMIAQIEHKDAIANLDGILKLPGLDSIFIGPYDLSGSMGYICDPTHPEVVAVIETAVRKARAAGVMVGMAVINDAPKTREWINKGVQWFYAQCDFTLLRESAKKLMDDIRDDR